MKICLPKNLEKKSSELQQRYLDAVMLEMKLLGVPLEKTNNNQELTTKEKS